MEFGAISATLGAVLAILLAAVVWLSRRLKIKNRQLRQVLAELRAGQHAATPPPQPEPIAIVAAEPALPCQTSQPGPVVPNPSQGTVDAFLWEHLSDAFLWKHLASQPAPAPAQFTAREDASMLAGMCDPATLQRLLESDPPFSGLVVLIGVEEDHLRRPSSGIESFLGGLLGPADFASRRSDGEFLLVCPGLRGAAAQRRLNEISERLWSFQLHGRGAFSLLFSWGGIGVEDQPLSEAIASATERMQQTKRSRLLFFRRKAG